MHPVHRRDRVAFADPAFAAHVNPRLAIAPGDHNGETRQTLGQPHVVDEALKARGGLGSLLLQSGHSDAGEENHRRGRKHSNNGKHDALHPFSAHRLLTSPANAVYCL